MKSYRILLIIFALSLAILAISGCGWIAGSKIDTQRVNRDEPVTTMTVPDQVKTEKILFAHDGANGTLVVTLTREADLFDIKTDSVNRQIFQESGYGK
jgi:hypothetical protein